MLNNSRPLLIAAGAFAVVFLIAAAAVFLLSGGDDEEPDVVQSEPTETPQQPGTGGAPEQALAAYVQTTLAAAGFVEDCTKAQPGTDAGKVCSTFRGERGTQRAYILGLVASEPSQWAILENQGGAWNVVHTPPITRDTSAVPGVPWPLRTGVDVVVAGAAPCVNVREGPSTNQPAVDCINDGTTIRLVAGPVPADNFQWWQVDGRTGWVVSDYLRYPDAAQ